MSKRDKNGKPGMNIKGTYNKRESKRIKYKRAKCSNDLYIYKTKELSIRTPEILPHNKEQKK